MTGLSKTLAKVSGVLPQIEIQLDLYEEPLIQQAAEKIYGVLVDLFQEMMTFYEESPLKHAWKSFSHPMSIRFSPYVEAITEQSHFMCALASALAKREQRSRFKMLKIMDNNISVMGKDVSLMAVDLSKLVQVTSCALSVSSNDLIRN